MQWQLGIYQMNKSKIQKHQFYNLRYIIESTHHSRSASIFFLLSYLFSYTSHLLLLKDISLINYDFTISKILYYFLFAIICILIVQSIIFMFGQKQTMLSFQFKLFRYVLMDYGNNYILEQIINNQSSLSNFDIIIYIGYFLFCLFCCKLFSLEQYHQKTLIKESSNYSLYLFAMNLVLQLREHTNSDAFKSGLVIILFIITFFALELQDNICSEKHQKFFIATINRLNMIFGVYLISKSLLLTLSDSLIFYLLSLFAYSLATALLKTRKTNLLRFYEIDLNTISTTQYLLRIQTFAFSIQRIIDGNKVAFDTEFTGFLAYHNQSCNMLNCPLYGQQAKSQLRSLQESKSIKSLAQKAKRHFQLVISSRARIFSEDMELNLAYLQYMVSYTKNKRKAQEIYNSLDQSIQLKSEYRLFELKNRINKLLDEDTLLNNKIPQMQYNQFIDIFDITLESVQNVCELLTQEQIDFSLLASSLIQMNKQKTFFQRYMEQISKMETFNAYKMLKMYSLLNSQIFNDKKLTQVIDTHIQLLVEKLDQKKSIQIISNRTEIGLIAISLSQSSLGNITSANNCALSIFGFEQKQLIGRTVNNIMPDIFAYYHDSLLKVFLSNKNKKVNGDERLLIGKNKNGYIFPVMLRLQRAIVSAQQLIFVANIRRYKTKQTPLMFITSPEGQVIDHTAGFQFYFMRKYNKKVKKMNIFELVPNFDQCITNQIKHLNICHQYKIGEQISAQFKITPLAFFGNIQAYYFFGMKTRELPVSSSASCLMPITNRISNLIYQQSLKFHKNSFNLTNIKHIFSISQKLSLANLRQFKTRQFTIPFIQLQDISNIIQIGDNGNIDYAKRIKTIRLVKRHFQPVTEEQEFKSSFEMEDTKQNRIQSVINSQQKQNKCTCYLIAKNLIWLVIFLLIILCIYMPKAIDTIKNKDNSQINLEILEYQIKEFVTDFIIFQKLRKSSKDQFFTHHIQEIYSRAIQNLNVKDSLQQKVRQSYFKIIYNLQSYSLQLKQLLQNNGRIQQSIILQTLTFVICYAQLGLAFVLFLLIIVNVYSSKNTLLSIFGFFLHIDEQIVLQLKRKCNFVKKSAVGSEFQLSLKKKSLANLQNQQEGGGLLRKFKSFRNISRKTDCNYIIQSFVFPFIVVIIIIIFININLAQETSIKSINNLKINLNRLRLQTSLLILNSYLTKIQASSIPTQGFKSNLEEFTYQIAQLKQSATNQTLKQIIDTLMTGNICSQKFFHFDDGKCQDIGDGISRSGLLSALDYLYSSINKYNNEGTFEFLLIPMKLKHIILQDTTNQMTAILDELVEQQQSTLNKLMYTLFTVIVLLLVSQIILLVQYPFRYMQNQIKMTLTVIKIFQSLKIHLKDKII